MINNVDEATPELIKENTLVTKNQTLADIVETKNQKITEDEI